MVLGVLYEASALAALCDEMHSVPRSASGMYTDSTRCFPNRLSHLRSHGAYVADSDCSFTARLKDGADADFSFSPHLRVPSSDTVSASIPP